MTPTTRIVRNQAFRPLESDIPEGMSVNEYRASRPRRPARLRRMLRLHRR